MAKKGASISGFPEWLPQERAIEQQVIDTLREVFELHGFLGIETAAVEMGSSLLKKGETSKEIYLLSRLQEFGQDDETPVEEHLGLHFDLTVPLSRYVVENSGAVTFPFKRWQIQKVWRGERPQEGRYREFTQADIDIVGSGSLPEHYEVDAPLVMVEALERLRPFGLPKATVHANNRKLSEGFYRGVGVTDIESVLREVDKLDKISAAEVAQLLQDEAGCSPEQAAACLELAEVTATDGSHLRAAFDQLCEKHGIDKESEAYPLAQQGVETLARIIDEAARIRPGSVMADLRIARGLDYYTGSVYETFLDGAEKLGSICSGGRYDNLVSQGNRKYPGVGLSIGVTRLISYVLHTVQATTSRISPAAVMVAVWNEDERQTSDHIAAQLRQRGIACDVAPTAAKIGKQIKYADHLGIPYVWFPPQAGNPAAEAEPIGNQVKNIISGDQVDADPASWTPAPEYARRAVVVK
ncbi:histidyl-tRNA ligase [Parascardovia denticolens IPLA 20019]|uniref:histidine--tRNA ligase n=1 Tax=Parascardovia denticolens TaxID=78258 RepID=UPI000266BAF2|nr:histidine--tRNA ligase [Parascardovia denticolens]EIT88451.1 histidyl-tRNA ligase [Parascardovia denticolens IPLA 20019]